MINNIHSPKMSQSVFLFLLFDKNSPNIFYCSIFIHLSVRCLVVKWLTPTLTRNNNKPKHAAYFTLSPLRITNSIHPKKTPSPPPLPPPKKTKIDRTKPVQPQHNAYKALFNRLPGAQSSRPTTPPPENRCTRYRSAIPGG